MTFRVIRIDKSWEGRPERTGYTWVRYQPCKPSKRGLTQDGQVRDDIARNLTLGARGFFCGYAFFPMKAKSQ